MIIHIIDYFTDRLSDEEQIFEKPVNFWSFGLKIKKTKTVIIIN